jgi:hypothetical protein
MELTRTPRRRLGQVQQKNQDPDGWLLSKMLARTRVRRGKRSQDLKEYAHTESCQLPHVALVLSGTLRVVMDDGSSEDFSKNDVMLLPPGHDAWTVGDEACVFVEFFRGNDYYGDH